MKILVTGAAGDIGSRLVEIFSQLEGVDLYTTALAGLRRDATSIHRDFDVRDEAFLNWVREIKPDVVVHLASIIKIPEGMSEQTAHDIDVVATENLLKVCVESGVQKFVVTSSGAAYGYWADNPEWIDESDEVRGNDDYFYSKHKKEVENILQCYREMHPQLKQVVLRPGTVLGPNFQNPITSIFEKRMITGIAGTSSPFVIIWVDDLVEYLIEAATTDVSGVFNVAGDGTLTLKQIASRLNKPYLSIPAWLVKFMLSILKPIGLSQYGPEQVKFIQYRPVLSNKQIKKAFQHQPQKSTREAFESFLASSDKEYCK